MHLLIQASTVLLVLDVVSGKAVWLLSAEGSRSPPLISPWLPDGSFDVLRCKAPTDTTGLLHCAVQPYGTVAYAWEHPSCHLKSDLPLLNLLRVSFQALAILHSHLRVLNLPVRQLPAMVPYNNGTGPRSHDSHGTMMLSTCMRLALVLPKQFNKRSAQPEPAQTIIRLHLDIASWPFTCHKLHMVMVSARSPFACHSTAALSRVYAVAAEQQDLWLVDGTLHEILQHWQGPSLP